jgi:hypothetical protein
MEVSGEADRPVNRGACSFDKLRFLKVLRRVSPRVVKEQQHSAASRRKD